MLKPIVFGLNYQTANLELRNQLAFASAEVPNVLNRLVSSGIVKEAILLSTCNRTELYCITNDINFVINALCGMHHICPRGIREHSYIYEDYQCAHHLFRVISGLDSMVLGESEIVAQIKLAMELAQSSDAIGSNLSGLFQMALSVEKDVRNHTAINNVAISMGHAVVNHIEQRLDQLDNKNVLFVGAGQMMQQIVPHFAYLDLDRKVILNRTVDKAQELAKKIHAEADSLTKLSDILQEFSVVVLCCASNQPIITAALLAKINHSTKQLLIDLSMPMVVEKQLAKNANLTLITIDDIAKLVDVGIEKRKLAAIEAESIISNKIEDYHLWQRKRGFTPLIRQLREQAEQRRLEVMALAEKQLLNGVSAQEVISQLSIQLTNKLLHQPTVNLCATNGHLQDNLIELVTQLYGLEN